MFLILKNKMISTGESSGEKGYNVIDMRNGDNKEVKKKVLERAVKCGVKVLNARLKDNRLEVDKWVMDTTVTDGNIQLIPLMKHSDKGYDLGLTRSGNLVKYNRNGKKYINILNLRKHTNADYIVELIGNKDTKGIYEKYNRHTIKSTVLGINSKFMYILLGENVIMIQYEGEEFIVPSFATGVWERVFIEDVSFEYNVDKIKGLKYNSNYIKNRLKELS